MSTSVPPKGELDKKIGAHMAPLSVTPQDVPNMTVKIRAGSYINSSNMFVEYAGGNSPVIPATVGNPRWTVVALTDAGTVTMVHGVAAAAAMLPAIPNGMLPLAAVYVAPTTLSITGPQLADVRPVMRIVDVVPNLAGELASRPTALDVANALLLTASNTGTPSQSFTLNNGFTVGIPNADAKFSVTRGSSPEVSIRWNESTDTWELTNDGVTFSAIAAGGGAGSYAPLVHTHVAADITNFNTAVTALMALTAVPQTQVTGLTASLAAKVDNTVQVLPGAGLTGGGALASNVTLTHALFGTPVTTQFAKFTTNASGHITSTTPVLGADLPVHTHVAADITNFATAAALAAPVQTVNGASGTVVLTAAGLGAAPLVHTHVAADITNFNTAADARITNAVGTTVQPLSSELTALAGLATFGITAHSAVGTTVTRSIAGTALRTVVTNGDGVAGNPTIDVTESGLDHNLLSNYAANRHIDHSIVIMTPGIGLTGGGNIVASRTFNIAAAKGTTTFDFTPIAAGVTAETTVTVTGASVGDTVTLSASTLEPGLMAMAFVSAVDTVTIRLANITAAAIDPASQTFNVIVFKYAGF
jgi:hypothetical protein